jgi:hypothetical protein
MTDWICPSCDAQISASENKCFCGAVRPSPEGIRFAAAAKDPPKFAIGLTAIGWVAMRVGFFLWISFGCLHIYYSFSRPILAEPITGRIYPLIQGGHTGYLTSKEMANLSLLRNGSGMCFVAGIIIAVVTKIRESRNA